MKKISIVFFGLIILAACSQDKEFAPDLRQGQDTEFNSVIADIANFEKGPSLDGLSTRTSLTYNNHISTWRVGDEIGAVTIQSDFLNTQSKFILDSLAHGSRINYGVFTGENYLDINDTYCFYYPYNKKSLRGGKIVFDMPIQTETKSYSFENFASCDFLYSNELLIPEPNQDTLFAEHTAKLQFTHGIGAIQLEFTKSTFAEAGVEEITKVNYVELRERNGANLFPQRVMLDASGNLEYSERLRSVYLFAGENGFDLTKSEEGFGGFMILFPTGDDPTTESQVQFLIHTNAGTFVANKILPQVLAQTFFTVTFRNATLSNDVFDWNALCSTPEITDDKILITKASELAWLAAISNEEIEDNRISDISFYGFTISIEDDIDLGGKNWSPINNFKGTIEGKNKKISNLKIIANQDNKGLIGINKGGVIKDLIIDYPEIVVRANNVGAFVGNSESGVLANCKVINGSVNGINNVGGLIGKDNYTLARSSVNEGTIVTALDSNVDMRVGNPSLD